VDIGLRKTARIQDMASGKYIERLEFKLPSGNMVSIELAPSTVSDVRLLEKHLRDAGAILPSEKASLKTLLEGVANSFNTPELVYAAHGGWMDNAKAFVRADKVIGRASSNVVGFRRSKPGDIRGKITRSGNIASWKQLVAAPAQSSTILLFGISAAFSAPLLKTTKRNTVGFCLFGPSRSGKTLATVVSGSVIGTGGPEYLLDWNATDNRLQEQLPEFNDCLAPIDDLMSMKGSDGEKYTRVKSLSYIFSLGANHGRHSSYSSDPSDNWRTVVLTSNELSLRDLAARSRAQRFPGETVRFVDVPATFNGKATIFDRIDDSENQRTWESWFKACEENQGHAIEAFLGAFLADKHDAQTYIDNRLKAFVAIVQDQSDGTLARDVAEKFGLVYAAGRLAIKYKLVPWKSSILKDAISKCYFAARDLLPDEGVTLRAGRLALRSFLKGLPNESEIGEDDNSSTEGFSRQHRSHYRCLVKRERFNSVFETDAQYEAVVQWLIETGYATLAGTSVGPKKMKEQHYWPDGQRYRSVEICWPRIHERSRGFKRFEI
jgi:putative DNA primase/helicase